MLSGRDCDQEISRRPFYPADFAGCIALIKYPGADLQHILVYSDSLSWGIVPTTRKRLLFEQRWPFFKSTNDQPDVLMEAARWWIEKHKLDHFEKAIKIKGVVESGV